MCVDSAVASTQLPLDWEKIVATAYGMHGRRMGEWVDACDMRGRAAATIECGQAFTSERSRGVNVVSPKIIVSILIACASPALVHAAEDPANSKLLKQCESAKGEVKKECEAVATKMITQPQEQRTDKTTQDVTHSSPAMDTESTPAKPAKPVTAKPTPPKQVDKKDAKPK